MTNTASTATRTLEVVAYYNGEDETSPMTVNFTIHTALDEAGEVAALFPKSYRLRATTLTSPKDGDYRNGTVVTGLVRHSIHLSADGANKGANETGIRRYHAIIRKAEALGFAVEFITPRIRNAYTSREAFEAALAGEAVR